VKEDQLKRLLDYNYYYNCIANTELVFGLIDGLLVNKQISVLVSVVLPLLSEATQFLIYQNHIQAQL
jgi:hypothetical protein